MAQSVEHPTLDFGSGQDPRVVGSDSVSGSVLSVKPAWDFLSVCPSVLLPLSPLMCSLSKINRLKTKHVYTFYSGLLTLHHA